MGGVSGGMGGRGAERSGAQRPGAIACHTTVSGFIYWTGQRGGKGWCQLQPRSWPNGREEFRLVSSTGLAWQRVGLQWRHGSGVRRRLYVTHRMAMETVSSYHSDSALGLPTVVHNCRQRPPTWGIVKSIRPVQQGHQPVPGCTALRAAASFTAAERCPAGFSPLHGRLIVVTGWGGAGGGGGGGYFKKCQAMIR